MVANRIPPGQQGREKKSTLEDCTMFIGPAFFDNPAKKIEHVFPTLIPKTKQKPTDHATQKTSMKSGICR